MRAEAIKNFLFFLGVKKESIRESDDFINSSCPLAFFTHKRHEDRNPSFGIKIDSASSYYYCFTCSPWPARLDMLVHNFWLMYGKYPFNAARLLTDETWKVKEEVKKKNWDEKKEVNPLPKYVVNQYPLLQGNVSSKAIQCKRYLERRGIPEWVYHYCKVRHDPKYGSLIFALTDCRGRVFMLRARSIRQKKMWTIAPEFLNLTYSFPRLSDIGIFFGSHLVDRSKPVMIVEGEMDQMRLISLGYFNVMASCTSAITNVQIANINASTIILGMDIDSSGKKGHMRIIKNLLGKSILYVADWKCVNRKDPGELQSKEELNKVIHTLKNIA